jgi:hypothetical protein
VQEIEVTVMRGVYMFPTDDSDSQKDLAELYSDLSTHQLLAAILVELKTLNERLAEVKTDGLMVKNFQTGDEAQPLKISGVVKSISYDMSW